MNSYLQQSLDHAADCLQARGLSKTGAQELANGRPISDPSDLATLGTPGMSLTGSDLYGRSPIAPGPGGMPIPNPEFQNSLNASPLGAVPTPFLLGQMVGHETMPEAANAAMNHTSGWEPMPGVPYEGDPNSHQIDHASDPNSHQMEPTSPHDIAL